MYLRVIFVCRRSLEMQDLTDPQHSVNSGSDSTSKLDKNILSNNITTNGTGGMKERQIKQKQRKKARNYKMYVSERVTC